MFEELARHDGDTAEIDIGPDNGDPTSSVGRRRAHAVGIVRCTAATDEIMETVTRDMLDGHSGLELQRQRGKVRDMAKCLRAILKERMEQRTSGAEDWRLDCAFSGGGGEERNRCGL